MIGSVFVKLGSDRSTNVVLRKQEKDNGVIYVCKNYKITEAGKKYINEDSCLIFAKLFNNEPDLVETTIVEVIEEDLFEDQKYRLVPMTLDKFATIIESHPTECCFTVDSFSLPVFTCNNSVTWKFRKMPYPWSRSLTCENHFYSYGDLRHDSYEKYFKKVLEDPDCYMEFYKNTAVDIDSLQKVLKEINTPLALV